MIVSRRSSVSTSFVLAPLALRCGRCMLTPPTRREEPARTKGKGPERPDTHGGGDGSVCE